MQHISISFSFYYPLVLIRTPRPTPLMYPEKETTSLSVEQAYTGVIEVSMGRKKVDFEVIEYGSKCQ